VCRLKEDYLRLGGLPTGEDKQLGMMEKAVSLRCIAILGKHFEWFNDTAMLEVRR
jgi:hypothetical protein